MGAQPQPVGVQGDWTLAFFDHFREKTIDLAKWWVDPSPKDGFSAENVSIVDEQLVLRVSETGGALITSDPGATNGGGFDMLPGDFVEAKINFAGTSTEIFNYPAFWVYGQQWPQDGENDIAEAIDGRMTVNYHSSSGAHNLGVIPGEWADGFHTYGLHRMASQSVVYYDGVAVKTYATDDDGGPQRIVIATAKDATTVYGSKGEVLVDYVRAWTPA